MSQLPRGFGGLVNQGTATQRPASIREILVAVKNQLVFTNVAIADVVVLIARNKFPKFQGPQTIFLHPRGVRADQAQARGHSRYGTVVSRILDVILQVQGATDTSGSDQFWLINDDRLFALEDNVLDALQHFIPIDSRQNALSFPLILMSETEPDRDARPVYGQSIMSFEVRYQPILSLPERQGRQASR